MGGSIRFPASMCGIVGLKPTRARTTLGPDFGEYWGPLTHEFVLTRSIRDTAAVLDAVAGAAPGDPYTAPPPRASVSRRGRRAAPGGCASGSAPRRPTATRRIADAVTRRRVDRPAPRRARSRRRRGRDPRARRQLQPGVRHGAVDGGRARRRALERAARPRHHRRARTDEHVLRDDGLRRSRASTTSPPSRTLQAWTRRVAAVVGRPRRPRRARRVRSRRCGSASSRRPTPIPRSARAWAGSSTFCSPFDVTGQPAMSLPAALERRRPPDRRAARRRVRTRRRACCASRAQLEQARPWADRRPPIHA